MEKNELFRLPQRSRKKLKKQQKALFIPLKLENTE